MVRKGVGERLSTMIGIDVSKHTLQCACIEATTKKIVWDKQVANSSAGITALLREIPVEVGLVVEPTGRYGLALVQAARQQGRDVRLAAPRKAKRFLQSQQSRAKTDKIDSRGLALFGLACPLPAYPVKEASVEQLDQLLSARRLLSQTIAKFQQQQSELSQTASVTAASLAAMQQDLKALDKQIAQATKTTPTFAAAKNLQTIPGIGPVTAAMVVSRLVAKQFATYDQFVAYCGLDIGIRQSGQRQGKTGLTKQGDAELRRLLYLAAQSNLRCKASPFKDQYQRELQKGLSKTSALCAVARKLAKVCWSVAKHGTEFEASRVGARSAPKETQANPHETQAGAAG